MIQSIRSVLAIPAAYQLWFNVVGGPARAKVLVNEYFQLGVGARILEIGCGPGTIVRYLPSEYLGFDLNGKLFTLDGVYADGQSPTARWLLAKDREEYVRSEREYVGIASQEFSNIRPGVRHALLRIPYTHPILECVR
jgi:hypothetical protein